MSVVWNLPMEHFPQKCHNGPLSWDFSLFVDQMRTPVGSVWPESGTRVENVKVPPFEGEPLKSALLTNVYWHQLKFIPRLSGCGAGGCRQFISPVCPAVIHNFDIIGRLEPSLLPQLILLTNVEEGFCPPFLTSICTRCSSPHLTGYANVSPSLSPSAGGWQDSLWVARPGILPRWTFCRLLWFGSEYGQFATSLDIIWATSHSKYERSELLKGHWDNKYFPVQMSLACICCALQRISVYWRTLLSTRSNLNLSTTAA